MGTPATSTIGGAGLADAFFYRASSVHAETQLLCSGWASTCKLLGDGTAPSVLPSLSLPARYNAELLVHRLAATGALVNGTNRNHQPELRLTLLASVVRQGLRRTWATRRPQPSATVGANGGRAPARARNGPEYASAAIALHSKAGANHRLRLSRRQLRAVLVCLQARLSCRVRS